MGLRKRNGTLELNIICFAVVTASFLLALDIRSIFSYAPGAITPLVNAFGIAYTAYFVSFAFLYDNRKFARLGPAFAAAGVIILVTVLLSLGSFNNGIVTLGTIYPLIIIYAISLPTTTFILLGFYTLRTKQFPHANYAAMGLFVVAIVLFLVYQLYIFGYSGVGSDDEMLLAYYALHALMAGHNPYTFNAAKILTSNMTKYGFTMLTNNTVVGRLDYPAFFMLSGLPFYALFNGLPGMVLDYGNSIGYLVMLLVSLFVFSFVASKRALGDMRIMVPMLFLFLLYSLQIGSFQYTIAIILFILIIRYIESKYVFILLGIAASLQEVMWVPVILVLAYLATTKGLKYASKIFLFSASVFLLINGYFIAIGPGTYMSQVLKPLNGNLLPSYLTYVSYIIQGSANIPLSGFSTVFYIFLVLSILITAYSGNKLTIFSGMFLSYLALDHSLIIYYVMPVAVMASAFAMGMPFSGKSRLKEWLKNRHVGKASVAIGITAAFAFALLVSVAYMHAAYVRGFGVSATGQHISIMGNLTYDNVSLNSTFDGTQNVYLLGYYYFKNSSTEEEGLSLAKDKIITDSRCTVNCTISGYMNYNIVTLHKGLNNVLIYVPDNYTGFECVVYKNGYYYLCPPISSIG